MRAIGRYAFSYSSWQLLKLRRVRCLTFDSENKDIKTTRAVAQKGLEEEAKKVREKAEAAEREKVTNAALDVALKVYLIYLCSYLAVSSHKNPMHSIMASPSSAL